MARLSRKQLKHDRFVEEIGEQVHFLAEHRNQALAALAAVIVVAVGTAAFFSYQSSQDQAGRIALFDSLRLYHGAVTSEQRPGYVTFATTGERVRRTTESLEKLRTDFAGRKEAQAADYYLGLLNTEQEKLDEAKPLLESAISGADPVYGSLARLALADVLRRQDDIEGAKAQYQALIDKPTSVVPASRAKLELARSLTEKDPAQATALLEELVAEGGPATGAASLTLRKIRGS